MLSLLVPLDGNTLANLFDLPMTVWEKVVRTICVYLGITLVLRFVGKRLMAQMNNMDLVVVLLLSNVVQNAIIGDDNSLTGGLLGALVLVVFNALIDRLAQAWPTLKWLLDGKPAEVITDGEIDHAAVTRLGITDNELVAALRQQGADAAHEVQRAALLPSGELMVKLKRGEQSATRDELAAAVAEIKAYLDERLKPAADA